jgi:hypothetical protein
MSLEFGSSNIPRAVASQERAEIVRARLPGILGKLESTKKEKFDDLMSRVIPWREEGYTIGLNALFNFVPEDVVQEVIEYVKSDTGEPNNPPAELLAKLQAIISDINLFEMDNTTLRSFSL